MALPLTEEQVRRCLAPVAPNVTQIERRNHPMSRRPSPRKEASEMNTTTVPENPASDLMRAAMCAVRVSDRAADGFTAILLAEDLATAKALAREAMWGMRELIAEDER